MELRLEGRARRIGDNINTDYIISSRRKRETLDESVLKRYLLETVDPKFAGSVRPGDVLVAGRNFGGGSAMEIAATVILAARITAVLAQSFSRTFFRNAINNGLVPVECDTGSIHEGDHVAVVLAEGRLEVQNRSRRESTTGAPIAGIMLEILEAGGLVEYVQRHGRLGA
jgi:3-isopropylmalate/(R)-2-methylmalate dehydratase small subunit